MVADKAALDRLLSDTFVFFHLDGKPDDKAGYIAGGERMRIEKVDVIDQDIVVYGDAAVVTSEERVQAKLIAQDRPISLHVRTMTVWASEDGQWRMTRYQPTPISRYDPTPIG